MLNKEECRYVDDIVNRVLDNTLQRTINTSIRKAFLTAAEKKEKDVQKMNATAKALIRQREALKTNIVEYKEELRLLRLGINTKTRSSDIVTMTSLNIDKEQLIEGRIITIESKLEKDSNVLEKLESILAEFECNDDKGEIWKEFIQFAFIEEWSDRDIAKHFGIHERTVFKKKRKIVERLRTRLFGTSSIEII